MKKWIVRFLSVFAFFTFDLVCLFGGQYLLNNGKYIPAALSAGFALTLIVFAAVGLALCIAKEE